MNRDFFLTIFDDFCKLFQLNPLIQSVEVHGTARLAGWNVDTAEPYGVVLTMLLIFCRKHTR